MRVIVIGAGVVGITTAWYLTAHGHEVTVIERHAGPAQEASFGNAGGICPSFAGPWAAPGMPFKAAKWLFDEFPPLKIRPKADLAQWRWLFQFLLNCRAERFADNKRRMQRVAHYSRHCLNELVHELALDFDFATDGVLQVFQTEEEAEGGRRAAEVLDGLGIAHRLVEPQEIATLEPALARSGLAFTAGLHLPQDGTGDSHKFTLALTRRLEERGCRFVFSCDASDFKRDGNRVTGLQTASGEMTADAYVIAAGAYAPMLCRKVGLRLPVYPVKGYSITAPIVSAEAAPLSSVMDEHSKVMITRLGDRLRAAGVAEIAGYDRSLPEAARRGLTDRVRMLFPEAVDYDEAQFWCGFRPMTPAGPARVGKTRLDNLFLNAGHGSNGWTQSCGTSRILADIICGRRPDIQP
ncbi:D-amino acid dehydrogenase [Jiella mangrovi]|uniref:D-amino acid dehydrogenase n=1 Tax=Jiella mangrovi TaxID=2821407 RepID=A0ABS4BIZ1_9HYPH|nr:D-amino acid dehydrogenase [Jiella mangrovi]MBP0616131.1 D-amino acid dehydrogenase [Jiella mangrovi]